MFARPHRLAVMPAMAGRVAAAWILVGMVAGSAASAPLEVGNGLIAFTRAAGSGSQIFTIAPDGTGESQLTFIGTSIFPAWSRDGTRIAFSSTRSGASEIWIMDADGSSQTQITFATPGGNFIPEWSPDDTRIVYASLQDDVGHPEVWVMNADGSNRTRLTVTPVNPGGPTWSLHPSWSADGLELVFASTASGNTEIWKMNADGSNQVQITNGNGPNFPDSNASEWSRDGSRVAFWSGFENQFGEVWSMDPDGSNKQQLTETADPRSSDNPVWSPDGTKILFDTNRAGPVEIWVMNADGSSPTRVVATAGGPPSWQPVMLPPGEPMPSLSGWGVMGMTLVLLVFGSAVLRRVPFPSTPHSLRPLLGETLCLRDHRDATAPGRVRSPRRSSRRE